MVQILNDDLCREENWALLGYYAAGSGNSWQMFREILSVPEVQGESLSRRETAFRIADIKG